MIKEIFYIMNMSILIVYYLINECIILVTKLSFVIITIIIKIVKVWISGAGDFVIIVSS